MLSSHTPSTHKRADLGGQMKTQKCVSFTAILITTVLFYASTQAQTTEEITPTPNCDRIIKADVVAFDQPFFYNRLGAVNPAGMIYALRRDVKAKTSAGLVPGNVTLKDYKRARPIVLRMNIGDCLQILFQNLLDPERVIECSLRTAVNNQACRPISGTLERCP